jgi:multimeric flavodoxin WrbA
MKQSNDAIIIFGSSRSNGNTFEAVTQVFKSLKLEFPLIDLAKFDVREFDYNFDQQDDFEKVVQTLLPYDLIILATPVYWYSVSAKMKSFIDRLSDLLIIDKPSGRQLRGKKLAVISSYCTYPDGANGFEVQLNNIAKYLSMTYVGTYLYYTGDDIQGQKGSENSLNLFVTSLLRII